MTDPVRLVLGFSPVSASDQIARAIVPALQHALDRRVEIALQPGNNGADAACAVARSAADGRTLFVATLGTHALAPLLNADLPYDPQEHFAPVSLVASAPLVLGCRASLPVENVRALIDFARAHPGDLTYGTSAVGGAPHLGAELFQALARIDMRHVQYERTEKLYEDLESGAIDVSFNNMMSMLPRCRAGKIKALGVTGATRSPAAEDLPALAETLPGYEVSNWVGIVAPKATPAAITAELSAGVAAAVRDGTVVSAFGNAGVTPHGGTPEEFAQHIAKELRRWKPIVDRFRGTEAERS